MVKVKNGFKVLQTRNRRLVSATDIGTCLRYYRNRRNYPKPGDGPLCVFTELMYAREFKYQIGAKNHCVYTCEYQSSQRKKVWTFDDRKGRLLGDMPRGKALAEWVHLRKRLA
jgi:hypothetical protein